ncbi:methyltransferase [Desulfuromonas versatilis]|uniref:Methyltransferase n=1 Tax=Desulfuromonas versatilis TaxID=2802975 RepID=A0ABM9SDK2_9BACT|nr:class I SAM-dependent methyltransferase [Desulfuromonas versatilis]BCR03448.1 methyltransferase [Desulfuromonas versatilis]
MAFKDHFSAQAGHYSKFRPHYPRTLFEFLASLAPARSRAWDCGTGSGQAAIGLAEFFSEVIATDASEKQIANAHTHPGVRYRVAPAEASGLETASVDLVTVAQALHWFDLDKFYAEVRRVLRSGGILAAWTYDLFGITPQVDAVVHHYYREIVGPYWPTERKWVEQQYRTIPFPFEERPAPTFNLTAEWELTDLLGMLRTWSATRICLETTGSDPVLLIEESLARAWGEPTTSRSVVWPLSLRVGEVFPGG